MPSSPCRAARATALVLLTVAGCAWQAAQARLRTSLDAHHFERPLAEVWPEALRLLAERGFDLVGQDRELARQGRQGAVAKLLSRGFETRSTGPGRREAGTDADVRGVRYVVEGFEAGGGSAVRFTEVRQRGVDPLEVERSRDLAMELALVRRLDPAAADRIEAAARPAR